MSRSIAKESLARAVFNLEPEVQGIVHEAKSGMTFEELAQIATISMAISLRRLADKQPQQSVYIDASGRIWTQSCGGVGPKAD